MAQRSLLKNDDFSINIALVECGKHVLGIVYIPAKETLYYREVGRGAFKIEGKNEPCSLRVLELPSIGGVWTVVESRSHRSPEINSFIKPLSKVE